MSQAMDVCSVNAEIFDAIKLNSVAGKIHVYLWGRDCDMCESDSVEVIPATVVHYKSLVNRVLDGAEGPCRVEIISAEEAAQFESSSRDLAMEAFEDGRGTAIIL